MSRGCCAQNVAFENFDLVPQGLHREVAQQFYPAGLFKLMQQHGCCMEVVAWYQIEALRERGGTPRRISGLGVIIGVQHTTK